MQVRVVRKMLDVVLRMVLRVVRLEGHAVVAHRVRTVLAEMRIAAPWDLPILLSPVSVDGVLLDELPWPVCGVWRRNDGGCVRVLS